jgi:lysophospholipase L1-like esterase
LQGDSITDSGRNYKKAQDLGIGYVMMISSWFSAKHPEKNVKFLNKGVSGNRIRNLRNRWQKDCIDLRPDVVSILIGVNDALSNCCFWNKTTTIEDFESDYRQILEKTRDVLSAKIMLLEPFTIGFERDQLKLRNNLKPFIETTRKLSKEFNAGLVPLDQVFQEAVRKREPSYWSQDGIHPTLVGHALIAQSWLEIVENVQT